MKTRILLTSILILAAVFTTGCRRRIAEFTVLSTKNIPHDFAVKGKADASESRYYVVLIPLRLTDPNARRAVDEAIDEQKGDVLLNARLTWRWWYIPLLIGSDGFSAQGDVASTRREPMPAP